MYNIFFGFRSNPFQLLPDPEFLFPSKVHQKALTFLRYGISSDTGGFILVSGEVGTGKTTIIRSMMRELKKDIVFSRVNNTRLTSTELIAMINDDFGLDIAGKDKTQLLHDLMEFLIEQYTQGNKAILIIDEAQNLTPELLEEIRLLSNLETDKAKLLQIILVGQPELRDILAQPGLRSFRQRTTVSCHINPLTREETEQYIFHRLEVAGNRQAVTFEDGAIDAIHDFARGVPRIINIVCDFLLLAAFTEQTREVSLSMVQEVIQDLERENRYWQSGASDAAQDAPDGSYDPGRKGREGEVYRRKKEIIANVSSAEKLLDFTAYKHRAELEHKYVAMDEKLNEMVRKIQDIEGRLKNGQD
jgi:putative secretion ATPase (PEP-CTERM system associated)